MTIEFNFDEASLPTPLNDFLIPSIENIEGTWKEIEKPKDELMKILTRLGVGGIKRRLVVNATNTYEIKKLWPAIVDFTEAGVPENRPYAPVSPRSDGEINTEATTEPSSPVKPRGVPARYHQKQLFPMGRFVEGEIIAGSTKPVEQIDPETGAWECLATIKNDVFLERRYSTKLNVTLFQTRALLSRKVDYQNNGKPVALRDEVDYSDQSLMFFKWTLVDHNDNDSKITCYYYLRRV